jgi:lauroyl/myristoyl acyltransferase
MIQKLIDFVPYWIAHALVALAIALTLWLPLGLVAGLAAGIAFYAGREHAQWEIYKTFDWKGLAAPLAVNGVLLAAYLAF